MRPWECMDTQTHGCVVVWSAWQPALIFLLNSKAPITVQQWTVLVHKQHKQHKRLFLCVEKRTARRTCVWSALVAATTRTCNLPLYTLLFPAPLIHHFYTCGYCPLEPLLSTAWPDARAAFSPPSGIRCGWFLSSGRRTQHGRLVCTVQSITTLNLEEIKRIFRFLRSQSSSRVFFSLLQNVWLIVFK